MAITKRDIELIKAYFSENFMEFSDNYEIVWSEITTESIEAMDLETILNTLDLFLESKTYRENKL